MSAETLPTFTGLIKAQSAPLHRPGGAWNNTPKTSEDAAARRRRLMGETTPKAVIKAEPTAAIDPALETVEEPKVRDVIWLDFNPTNRPPISHAETIIRQIMRKHQVTRAELMGPQRSKYIVMARREAAWRMKRETTLSLPQIGIKLGGRDHTTILYNVRAYEAEQKGEVYRKYSRRYYEAKRFREEAAAK